MTNQDHLSQLGDIAVSDQEAEREETEQIEKAQLSVRNHVATLALALSVAKIEIVTSQGSELLEAVRVVQGASSTEKVSLDDRWLSLAGSVMTASGFELRSRIEFGQYNPSMPRALPREFDVLILGKDTLKTIASSAMNIRRDSPVHPNVMNILGITAMHTVMHRYNQPGFEYLAETAGPGPYKPVFAALEEVSAETADFTELGAEMMRVSSSWTPNETVKAHFATPDDLEIPDDVMQRAKNNFNTLASRINTLNDPQTHP